MDTPNTNIEYRYMVTATQSKTTPRAAGENKGVWYAARDIMQLRHSYEYYYSRHKLHFQNTMRAGDQKLTMDLPWCGLKPGSKGKRCHFSEKISPGRKNAEGRKGGRSRSTKKCLKLKNVNKNTKTQHSSKVQGEIASSFQGRLWSQHHHNY